MTTRQISNKNVPFRSIPAENAFDPAPVITPTRLQNMKRDLCELIDFDQAYSSGSSSNHFHNLSISQHASTGKAFIRFARLMVTKSTCGTGTSTRTNCISGWGLLVDLVMFLTCILIWMIVINYVRLRKSCCSTWMFCTP